MDERVSYRGRVGVVVWVYSDGDVRVMWPDGSTEDCNADYCELIG